MTKLPFISQVFTLLMGLLLAVFSVYGQKDELKATELKFKEVLHLVNTHYMDTVNDQKLTEAAVKAMLKELDPHSTYIAAKDVKKTNEPLEGSFEGVGITYQVVRDTFMIMTVVRGGPAMSAGLLGGDRILNIDDKDVTTKQANESNLISGLRGKKGSEVRLKILRMPNRQIMEFTVERDKIPIHSVESSFMADENTGYIKLSRFSANTIKEFRRAFDDLKELGMQDLILDIRGNGGGYLNAAVDLSDEFLKKDQVIVSTRGRNSPEVKYVAHGRGKYESGRLIVLIDESSASASEIFAGSVQDHDRGIVAGRRSYGKGLVQKPYYLPDGSMIRLTTARYYTPSGRCIQKPFNEGAEKYFRELAQRGQKGEFVHPDSIHFPDSLRYATGSGRFVYGGGGIVPDVFIPADSARLTSFYKECVKVNIINETALGFLESRRHDMKSQYPLEQDFVSKFSIDSLVFNNLLGLAEKNEIKYSEKDLAMSGAAIKNMLKAIIARDIYGQEAYYRVLAEADSWVAKAMEMMSEGKVFSELGVN